MLIGGNYESKKGTREARRRLPAPCVTLNYCTLIIPAEKESKARRTSLKLKPKLKSLFLTLNRICVWLYKCTRGFGARLSNGNLGGRLTLALVLALSFPAFTPTINLAPYIADFT